MKIKGVNLKKNSICKRK